MHTIRNFHVRDSASPVRALFCLCLLLILHETLTPTPWRHDDWEQERSTE
jgi:hypothetical protein